MAAKAKHTPGPYLRDGTLVFALEDVRGYRGGMVKANRFSAQVSRGPNMDKGEAEATAALFAAAPDLLDALTRLLAVADDEGLGGVTPGGFIKVLQDSRAAIAKAEGR